MTDTFWNGLPAAARQVTGVMVDAPEFPEFWARGLGLIGKRVNAVEVDVNGHTDYLFDECLDPTCEFEDCSPGWFKVTEGRGSPRWGHRNVTLTDVMPR